MQGDRLGPGIASEHPYPSGGGPQNPQQNPQGGGLAGAVGPEEAVDLSCVDSEIEPVQCVDVTEMLVKIVYLDHMLRVHLCSRPVVQVGTSVGRTGRWGSGTDLPSTVTGPPVGRQGSFVGTPGENH